MFSKRSFGPRSESASRNWPLHLSENGMHLPKRPRLEDVPPATGNRKHSSKQDRLTESITVNEDEDDINFFKGAGSVLREHDPNKIDDTLGPRKFSCTLCGVYFDGNGNSIHW